MGAPELPDPTLGGITYYGYWGAAHDEFSDYVNVLMAQPDNLAEVVTYPAYIVFSTGGSYYDETTDTTLYPSIMDDIADSIAGIEDRIAAFYLWDEPYGWGPWTYAQLDALVNAFEAKFPAIPTILSFSHSNISNGIPPNLDYPMTTAYPFTSSNTPPAWNDYVSTVNSRIAALKAAAPGKKYFLWGGSFGYDASGERMPTPEETSWYWDTFNSDTEMIGLFWYKWDHYGGIDTGAVDVPEIASVHRQIWYETKYGGAYRIVTGSDSLPDAAPLKYYETEVIAVGGDLLYEWSVDSGSLPPGLSLDTTTGKISGTPGWADTETPYTFTIKVTDDSSNTVSKQFSITLLFTDTDSDGMDDRWEIYYFGNLSQGASGDADGDGSTNIQEYGAGTNPNEFKIVTISKDAGGLVTIEWSSVYGRSYAIYYSDGPFGAAMIWTPVPNQGNIAGTGGMLSWLDNGSDIGSSPATKTQRYYKVLPHNEAVGPFNGTLNSPTMELYY